jgi:hypothetical protein
MYPASKRQVRIDHSTAGSKLSFENIPAVFISLASASSA